MRKQRMTVHFMVLLLVFATTLFTSACLPGIPGGFLVIDNQRSEEVRISVTLVSVNGNPSTPETPIDYGVVPAQTTKELATISFGRREYVNRIEAVDLSGKVVFSHDYNWYDLEKIEPKLPPNGKIPRWKIVISDNNTP